MIDNPDAKLNAIVGSALKALVESGADSEVIGAFAATHRLEVAQILGFVEAPAQSLDLQSIVSEVVSQVLATTGVGAKPSRRKARVFVMIAGRRTSITLNAGTLEDVGKAKGSAAEAKRFVQELAGRAPQDAKNRSGWIEERLKAFLSVPQASPLVEPQRH